jgi:hypothetical protein
MATAYIGRQICRVRLPGMSAEEQFRVEQAFEKVKVGELSNDRQSRYSEISLMQTNADLQRFSVPKP